MQRFSHELLWRSKYTIWRQNCFLFQIFLVLVELVSDGPYLVALEVLSDKKEEEGDHNTSGRSMD